MKNNLLLIMILFLATDLFGQDDKGKKHYVCIQSTDVYHDRFNCAGLQMCSGGRTRMTRNVGNMKPCPKCAAPIYKKKDFNDIKRVLGVKDKKQIKDSLGTSESTIHKPEGFSIRISGPPESRTVNMLEFFFSKPVTFNEDSLFSPNFYRRLGLQFEGCHVDTIRNTVPHPVTGKIKKDVTIEYRGCAIVEARDSYEDKSRYYYELTFVAKENERTTDLEKVQLILKAQ